MLFGRVSEVDGWGGGLYNTSYIMTEFRFNAETSRDKR